MVLTVGIMTDCKLFARACMCVCVCVCVGVSVPVPVSVLVPVSVPVSVSVLVPVPVPAPVPVPVPVPIPVPVSVSASVCASSALGKECAEQIVHKPSWPYHIASWEASPHFRFTPAHTMPPNAIARLSSLELS